MICPVEKNWSVAISTARNIRPAAISAKLSLVIFMPSFNPVSKSNLFALLFQLALQICPKSRGGSQIYNWLI